MNNEEVVNKWIASHSNMKQISTELEDALSKGEHPNNFKWITIAYITWMKPKEIY